MTEQEARDTPAGQPVAPRHRRSAAASVAAWWSGVRQRHRREVIAGGGVLALVLVLVLGYAFLVRGYTADDRAGPAASAPPPDAVRSPSPGVDDPSKPGPSKPGPSKPGPSKPGPSKPGPSKPGPSKPGSPGKPPATDGPPDSGTAPPAGRPEPRRVGPKSFAGFARLLARYCQEQGHRTAVLLDGPDGNRTGGDWVCVRVVTFTRINLDRACRDAFGDGSQARRTQRSDSRTWRCYDS